MREGTVQDRVILIAICEDALVPQKVWHNRDSESSQRQVGECWALLNAGCDFYVHEAGDDPAASTQTTWVTVVSEGFQYFEIGDLSTHLFYLPTRKRLDKTAGKDWY